MNFIQSSVWISSYFICSSLCNFGRFSTVIIVLDPLPKWISVKYPLSVSDLFQRSRFLLSSNATSSASSLPLAFLLDFSDERTMIFLLLWDFRSVTTRGAVGVVLAIRTLTTDIFVLSSLLRSSLLWLETFSFNPSPTSITASSRKRWSFFKFLKSLWSIFLWKIVLK